MRTYAIGDIHGQLDKLAEAHRWISDDRAQSGDASAPVVHVGDLVDRGPDSRGVIEFLANGQAGGAPWVTLMGNHDRMFLGFLGDPDHHDPGLRPNIHWVHRNLGGAETLASYGVERAGERLLFELHDEAVRQVPASHVAFLTGLPYSYRRGDLFFAHAGIRPGISLERQTEDDLVWIRRDFLDDPRDHGVLVVHGHTPVDQATHYGNRLNIDTGAGYGRALTAVVIEGDEVWTLGPDGRTPVARAAGLV
ncbi:MAG: metallophosphoesterase [Rhodobacteraceae bacterium]|nr:metallophosphoesterase [Paracoccaceae bacterium]